MKKKPKLILASSSIKRKEILESLKLDFKVVVSHAKELATAKKPHELVINNANLKVLEVLKNFPNDFIIGSDTIVVSDKKIFGKPKNFTEGEKMLTTYKKQKNFVYTGLAIYSPIKKKIHTDYKKTQFLLNSLPDDKLKKIFKQIFSKEQSGGFSIEGMGAILLDQIKGSFYNILGLPPHLLYEMFISLDYDLLKFQKNVKEN